jgi:hypothetical protein
MRVNPTSGPITGDTMESRWNAELQNCRFHLWRHSVVLKRSIGSDSYSMVSKKAKSKVKRGDCLLFTTTVYYSASGDRKTKLASITRHKEGTFGSVGKNNDP